MLAATVLSLATLSVADGIWLIIFIRGLAGIFSSLAMVGASVWLLQNKGYSQGAPIHVWAVFGLGAVPSCFLWQSVVARWGTRTALFTNLAVQAIGVVLPVISNLPAAYLASALIVGGTFMGTVTIAMPAASRIARTVQFNVLAAMTAAYGVGQIAGPVVANYLFDWSHSFSAPLTVAGIVLWVAAMLCIRVL